MTRRWGVLAGAAWLSMSLAGCGGDSGSAPVAAPAQPPAFTSATTVSVVENVNQPIYLAAATDPSGAPLTFAIAGGADAGKFTITSAGQLSFNTPPNYDLPGNAAGDNVYQVQISASDGKLSTTLSLTVTVTNSKEGIAVHRVATGFTNPVAISPVNATTVLVAEKAGAIYQLNPQTGAKTLLVQIPDLGGPGVLAIAAAPNFATTGKFFVLSDSSYNYLTLTPYERDYGGATFPGVAIFSAPAPQYAGGGGLTFDATGTLYVETGDAGGVGDPTGSAQNASGYLGKLIRVAPNPDPYAGASVQDYIVSVAGIGLHQPNGGALTPSGALLFADRGQAVAEEVDLFTPGGPTPNYGWPFKEGTQVVQGMPTGVVDPVAQYLHGSGARQGQAVIGGAAGPAAIASLSGQYVFGDGAGAIFTVPLAQLMIGSTLSSDRFERRDLDFAPDQGTISHPVAITADPSGTLYILDADGDLFRVDAG